MKLLPAIFVSNYFAFIWALHGQSKTDFRLSKYKAIWLQALSTVPKEKLEDLRRVLKKLDKAELELKHTKSSGKPYDGEFEASVRERLLDVMHEYGLTTNEVSNLKLDDATLYDPRLNKLWDKALQDGGYTDEELSSLRTEFDHVQARIHEYEELAKIVKKHDIDIENDIDSTTDHRSIDQPQMSKLELKLLKNDLKEKYHGVKDKVHALEQELNDRVRTNGSFTDIRVIELWEFARQSGKFTDVELAGIKEELQHFQVRISKHRHWMEQSEKLGAAVNQGETHLSEEYEDVLAKEKEHAKIVKKYHATMLDRVGHHQEL